MRKKPNPIKTGDRFTTNEGCEVIVVDYVDAHNISIIFPGYDYRAKVRAAHLRNGGVKNPYKLSVFGVGFFGEGPGKAWDSGNISKEYVTWRGMLKRCYYKEINPVYLGCSVHPEWHNFQNFVKWFRSQKQSSIDGIQLDKDLIIQGNRIYSEATCTLVPKAINCLITDSRSARGDNPIGVSYHRKYRKFGAHCNVHGELKHLGYFTSPITAHEAYRDFKEDHVRKVAEKYKHEIDPRAYHALMCYKVTCPIYEAMI